MTKIITGIITIGLSLWLTTAAKAALTDQGMFDGVSMIYDSTQDITWLGDANWAQTSGFDADGIMNWTDANAWADGLTIGGLTDWRLPIIFDETCTGSGCTNGEMGHLFNVDGVTAVLPGPFINLQSSYYASGTESSTDTGNAWVTSFGSGSTDVTSKSNQYFAWGVRDGITVTPEPISTALFLVGGAPIAVSLYRKKKRSVTV